MIPLKTTENFFSFGTFRFFRPSNCRITVDALPPEAGSWCYLRPTENCAETNSLTTPLKRTRRCPVVCVQCRRLLESPDFQGRAKSASQSDAFPNELPMRMGSREF